MNCSCVCPGRVVIEVGILTSGLVLDTARWATSGTFDEFKTTSQVDHAPAATDPLGHVTVVGRMPVMERDVVCTAPSAMALITASAS